MNYLFPINVNPFSETINVKACVQLFLQKWCLNPRLNGFSEVMSLNFIANNYWDTFGRVPKFLTSYEMKLYVFDKNLRLGGSEPVVTENSCSFSFDIWPTKKACEKLWIRLLLVWQQYSHEIVAKVLTAVKEISLMQVYYYSVWLNYKRFLRACKHY